MRGHRSTIHATRMSSSPSFGVVQKSLSLPQKPRGCHIITKSILDAIPELRQFQSGSLNVFLQHTSASLTINENCCSDVRTDLESWTNTVAPEGTHWRHSDEGRDDMPAHAKSSMLGVSIDIPVMNGSLCLGRWQGIYLCEHRNRGGSRRVVLTLTGTRKK